jgi:hypothetical protein
LNVQPHLVAAVDKAQTHKGLTPNGCWGVFQTHLALRVAGEEEVHRVPFIVAQILGDDGVALVLPGRRHHRELDPAGLLQFA